MRSMRGDGEGQDPLPLVLLETGSFPHPGQDYFEGLVSLDRHVIRRPASTFLVRMTGDGLASMGVLDGDELVVDRAVPPAPGRVLVVVAEGEHRVGVFRVRDGQAMLESDVDMFVLDASVEPFGVALVAIKHLPLTVMGAGS